MYLKSLKANNFRKFGIINNEAEFGYKNNTEDDINISQLATLIIGKNNSGKTSLIQVLKKLVGKSSFKVTDFNFEYLNRKLTEYKKNIPLGIGIEPLKMEFKIKIDLLEEENYVLGNLSEFISLDFEEGSSSIKEVVINAQYEMVEVTEFNKIIKEKIKEVIDLKKFISLLEKIAFKLSFYNKENEKIENFKLESLIEIKEISATREVENLNSTFNKIIQYHYLQGDTGNRKEIDKEIENINVGFDTRFKKEHDTTINDTLHKVESREKITVELSSDLNLESLIKNIVKYEYKEGGYNIPAAQFGTGYSNLLSIVGELIDYIIKNKEDSINKRSKINLISIEEPEIFMHAQMQELFIKNIEEALKKIIQLKDKKINWQMIITTHSHHILNSKIHSGNTFNNIVYMLPKGINSEIVKLNDKIIGDKLSITDLIFLKKHIKYKVSELFFADAVIFIEGLAEEILLPHYVEGKKGLAKKYISICTVGGAHAHVYRELIEVLKIPCLIITDLDIKREYEKDKEGKSRKKLENIRDIKGKITTNETLKKYSSETIERISSIIEDKNLKIVTQQEAIEGQYATSFEEALILTNYKNIAFNEILKEIKPNIYNELVEDNVDNLIGKSYEFYTKLSKEKSDFANKLLYKMLTCSEIKIEIPKYIDKGLIWLENKLENGIGE